MSLFAYRAINDDNKEVHGQVEALTLEAASQALKDQHLDVVELHEASRAQKQSEAAPAVQPTLRTTFAFEGTDAAGTVRRGTIQSESKFQAFERLKQDQKLLVTMLSPLGVTPQHRDNDLENWQRKEMTPVAPKPSAGIPQQPKQSPVPKPIGFTMPASIKPVLPSTAPQAPVASGTTHMSAHCRSSCRSSKHSSSHR